jgi:alpha-D-xyloside xylohydrolase
VLPVAASSDRPDYDYAGGVVLHLFEIADGARTEVVVPVTAGSAEAVRFRLERHGERIRVVRDGAAGAWALALPGSVQPGAVSGADPVDDLPGVLLPGPILRATDATVEFHLPLPPVDPPGADGGQSARSR